MSITSRLSAVASLLLLAMSLLTVSTAWADNVKDPEVETSLQLPSTDLKVLDETAAAESKTEEKFVVGSSVEDAMKDVEADSGSVNEEDAKGDANADLDGASDEAVEQPQQDGEFLVEGEDTISNDLGLDDNLEESVAASSGGFTESNATSANDRRSQWVESGSSFYWHDDAGVRQESGWLVTDKVLGTNTTGVLQRYWIDPVTHSVVFGTLINVNEDWAYATEFGYVVRGRYVAPDGKVYLADNDGRLEEVGWLVTDAYGQGLQRYWIDSESHAAEPGFSSDGWSHYTVTEGYVLRGEGRGIRGERMIADNDGRLAVSRWVVTDSLGQGIQRYWFDAKGVMAVNRLVDPSEGSGWWAWATSEGYVFRGKYDNGGGRVYIADNDGRLPSGSGWVITGAYDGGVLQRYYIDAATHAACSGFFTVDNIGYFGLGKQGYVLRGKNPWNSVVLLSDNDGRMVSGAGWLVTDKYDGTHQRYWIVQIANLPGYFGAQIGRFTADLAGSTDDFYGRPHEGFVVRGVYVTPSGEVINADNDGRISRYLHGIDMAVYQNGIDLAALSLDFVFIKATEGTGYINPIFRKYANQALTLGLKLGLYHFVDTRFSAEEQADFFVQQVGDYIGQAALMLDWENNEINDQNNLSAGTAFAKRFLDRVYQQTGVKPLIYMSRSVVHSYDWTPVAEADYGLWCAQYPYKYYDEKQGVNGPIINPDRISYLNHGPNDFGAWGSNLTMYQYTSTGKLSGWNGFLDLNVFYGNKGNWDALARQSR